MYLSFFLPIFEPYHNYYVFLMWAFFFAQCIFFLFRSGFNVSFQTINAYISDGPHCLNVPVPWDWKTPHESVGPERLENIQKQGARRLNTAARWPPPGVPADWPPLPIASADWLVTSRGQTRRDIVLLPNFGLFTNWSCLKYLDLIILIGITTWSSHCSNANANVKKSKGKHSFRFLQEPCNV